MRFSIKLLGVLTAVWIVFMMYSLESHDASKPLVLRKTSTKHPSKAPSPTPSEPNPEPMAGKREPAAATVVDDHRPSPPPAVRAPASSATVAAAAAAGATTDANAKEPASSHAASIGRRHAIPRTKRSGGQGPLEVRVTHTHVPRRWTTSGWRCAVVVCRYRRLNKARQKGLRLPDVFRVPIVTIRSIPLLSLFPSASVCCCVRRPSQLVVMMLRVRCAQFVRVREQPEIRGPL